MTDELIVNPNARLQPVSDDHGPLGYRVFAPAREGAARDVLVTCRDVPQSSAIVDPALVQVLDRMHAADDDVELGEREVAGLAELKLMIPPALVSASVEYLCLLDVPAERPPEPATAVGPVTVSSLVLAPDLGSPPAGIDTAYFENRWNRRHPIAWVRDPRTDAWYPYHLTGRMYELLQQLRETGDPSRLDRATTELLIAAHILVPAGADRAWGEVLQRARESYRLNAYALIPGAIPPLHLDALRRYYTDLIGEGYVPFGDPQVPKRYYRHSEHIMCYYHAQLTSLYRSIVGVEIKPSYCYLGSYLPGAELRRHTDREQCEFTASTQIDFKPEHVARSEWRLYLEQDQDPRETFGVNLARGDTVIYRGRELAHYRDELPEGRSSTSFFLHYVHADFEGPLY